MAVPYKKFRRKRLIILIEFFCTNFQISAFGMLAGSLLIAMSFLLKVFNIENIISIFFILMLRQYLFYAEACIISYFLIWKFSIGLCSSNQFGTTSCSNWCSGIFLCLNFMSHILKIFTFFIFLCWHSR